MTGVTSNLVSPIPLWKRSRSVKPDPPDPSDPNITRLPANGPKPDQSVSAWLYGKEQAHRRATDINTNSNKTT